MNECPRCRRQRSRERNPALGREQPEHLRSPIPRRVVHDDDLDALEVGARREDLEPRERSRDEVLLVEDGDEDGEGGHREVLAEVPGAWRRREKQGSPRCGEPCHQDDSGALYSAHMTTGIPFTLMLVSVTEPAWPPMSATMSRPVSTPPQVAVGANV
jgi:hypothetical protein